MIRRAYSSALMCSLIAGLVVPGSTHAAEEWEIVLKQLIGGPSSQDRQDALKQIDVSGKKGLRALWGVLDNSDPSRIDWFVREGAFEVLLGVETEEALEEIESVINGPKKPRSKEAILYSIIWKLRKQVVDDQAGTEKARLREEAKFKIRKLRGLDYFGYVMPSIAKLDPEGRYLKWIHTAMKDKSDRVRIAAITGLMAYPHRDNIPLLLDNMQALEKKKSKYYREWVVNRFALEQLTGQYFREDVKDWLRWWDVVKDTFSLEKRVEEEQSTEGGKTFVAKKGGVEVTVHMKVAGEGYPLIVLPWRGYEVDYMRPYFHGIEEFMKVYYVRMPQLGDFKGLAREKNSNLVRYPTLKLAEAFSEIVKESGLKKFAVLAHGWEAGHLGMLLAKQYEDSVSHLIFINPWSGGDSFRRIVTGLRVKGQKTKNPELVKGARSRFIKEDGKPEYVAADDAEAGGMSRATFNAHFADPSLPEVGALQFLYGLPGGSGGLIDNDWRSRNIFKSAKTGPRTLVFHGMRSGWMDKAEAKKVAGVIPGARTIPLKGSGELPFVSETYAFTKHIEKFVAAAVKQFEKAKKAKRKK